MNHRFLNDIFQVKLISKYHSAKLRQIKHRKISKELREQSLIDKYKRNMSFTQQQRDIAMKNLQLVKRLAEVRQKQAEIIQIWEGNKSRRKHGSSLSQQKPNRNILKQWDRMVQNQRLGKSIDVISRRKKNMILPSED